LNPVEYLGTTGMRGEVDEEGEREKGEGGVVDGDFKLDTYP
jgi:hypothetical protein